MANQTTPEQSGNLSRRRIALPDGRYLIFYTFGEEAEASTSQTNTTVRPQPDPEPEAVEETGV